MSHFHPFLIQYKTDKPGSVYVRIISLSLDPEVLSPFRYSYHYVLSAQSLSSGFIHFILLFLITMFLIF